MTKCPIWPPSHECDEEHDQQRLAFAEWYNREEEADPAVIWFVLDSVSDQGRDIALRQVAKLLAEHRLPDDWSEEEILEWLEDCA